MRSRVRELRQVILDNVTITKKPLIKTGKNVSIDKGKKSSTDEVLKNPTYCIIKVGNAQ